MGDSCDQDRDGDGLSNETDNCPDVANANQRDLDRNGQTPVIQIEMATLSKMKKTYVQISITQTEDFDGDGLGDDCDPNISDAEPELSDEDNDGFNFVSDNCVTINNPEQNDSDRDGNGTFVTMTLMEMVLIMRKITVHV